MKIINCEMSLWTIWNPAMQALLIFDDTPENRFAEGGCEVIRINCFPQYHYLAAAFPKLP